MQKHGEFGRIYPLSAFFGLVIYNDIIMTPVWQRKEKGKHLRKRVFFTHK